MRVRSLLFSFLIVLSMSPLLAVHSVDAQIPDLEKAKTTAWQLSVFESQSDWNALYDQMHPDSKAFVNRQTVAYWYATYFAPNGPNPATITGAQLVDWTWPVNGRTYANTAEISFIQQFDNGSTVNDVVRLVQIADGTWHWFFGRSFDFIQKIAQEAGQPLGTGTISESGSTASTITSFDRAIAAINRVPPVCFIAAGTSALPESIGLLSIDSRYPVSDGRGTGEMVFYNLAIRREFPELIVNVITLQSGKTPETFIDGIRESQLNWDGPQFTSPPRNLNRDLDPNSAYLISYYEEYSEPLGFVPVFVWGPRGGNAMFALAGPATASFEDLVVAWSANARALCTG